MVYVAELDADMTIPSLEAENVAIPSLDASIGNNILIGVKDALIVHFDGSTASAYYDEIKAAADSGRYVYGEKEGIIIPLNSIGESSASFVRRYRDSSDFKDDVYIVSESSVAHSVLSFSAQSVISDLNSIRSGAAAGATALQNGDNVSDLINDAGYITEHQSLSAYRTAQAQDNIDANFFTLNTAQTVTAKKVFRINETVRVGGQETAVKILSAHKKNEITAPMWAGRMLVGNKTQTFLLGTYRGNYANAAPICGLGAHNWTDAETETGGAWDDLYIEPDGNKAVYFGGKDWRLNGGWLKVQNNGNAAAGYSHVFVNRGSITVPDWKEALAEADNVSKLTNDAGYLTLGTLPVWNGE